MTSGARPDRGRLAARQAAEYLVAALLVGAAVHAPHHGELLFGAGVVGAGWAALHRAPLGPAGLIGTGLHRVGLAVLALAMAGLGFRYLTDVAISGPFGLAAIAFGQLAIGSRRSTKASVTASTAGAAPTPAPGTPTVTPTVLRASPSPPPSSPPSGPPAAADAPPSANPPAVDARKIGYIAGQMGTLLGREAQRALPAGARRAGRGAGRLLRRRSPPPPAPAERLDDRPQ